MSIIQEWRPMTNDAFSAYKWISKCFLNLKFYEFLILLVKSKPTESEFNETHKCKQV